MQKNKDAQVIVYFNEQLLHYGVHYQDAYNLSVCTSRKLCCAISKLRMCNLQINDLNPTLDLTITPT